MNDSNGKTIFAQLSDSTDQTPLTTERAVVNFNTQDSINGISHDINNKPQDITILEDGVYMIIAAGQVGRKSGSLLRFIDLWININGEDVSNSTVRASAPASLFVGDTFVLVTQSAMPLKKGDVLNIIQAVSSEDEGLGLIVTKPEDKPVIPSIIFTMWKIGN